MARLPLYLFSLFLFFQLNMLTGSAQSESQADKNKALEIERNLRAMKTYCTDATAVFEGFMLCEKYAEKQKLLAELGQSVKQIDAFAQKAEYITNREAAIWRAKAHFLYGVALGVVGERKLSEFEVGVANEPLFAEIAKEAPSYKEEEIRIGDKNQKLVDLEQLQQENLSDLATIKVAINPEKRNEVGLGLKLNMLSKPKVTHNEFVPYVLAHAETKLNELLLKEGQRDFIYLPAGQYEISKSSDDAIISQFEVKELSKIYSVSLPPFKFPAKFIYLGVGLLALGALGFFIF